MKSIKYIIILVIFFSIHITINAKDKVPVAGYLGKRFAIGYAPTIEPFGGIFIPLTSDGLKASYFNSFNVKHRIDINYVVEEHAAVSFDVSFQKWGVISNIDENGYVGSSRVFESIKNQFGIDDFQYVYASSTKFTLGYLSTEGIAPRGVYYGIGLSYEIMTPHMVDLKGNEITLSSVTDFGFMFRYGARRIFYDRIMLDAAFTVEPNFTFFKKNESDYYNYSRSFNGNQDFDTNELGNLMKQQAGLHSLLGVKLGVYYLL